MAYYFDITTKKDDRGKLSVIDNDIPFVIKRVYYIYGVNESIRGGHRHKITKQLLICLSGSCKVKVVNNELTKIYNLKNPSIGLYLNPEDWHNMYDFTEDAVLLVLASEHYNLEDYITSPY